MKNFFLWAFLITYLFDSIFVQLCRELSTAHLFRHMNERVHKLFKRRLYPLDLRLSHRFFSFYVSLFLSFINVQNLRCISQIEERMIAKRKLFVLLTIFLKNNRFVKFLKKTLLLRPKEQ